MNIKIKTTIIILITFIVGMVAGSMLTQAFFKYRMKRVLSMRAPAGFVAHFERIIEPTAEQREAVRKILDKYGKKFFEVREKMHQEFLPIQEAIDKELEAILTPEQKKRLDERFLRRGPPGFFKDRPDKHPAPPWLENHMGKDKKTPPPPWPREFRDKDKKPPIPPWEKENPNKNEKEEKNEESKQ